MATHQNSSSRVVVSSVFLEGLALDISILEALLKRHRTSHGRTLYYRRMAMALKSVQKTHNIVGAVARLENLQKDANQYVQDEKRKRKKNKKGQAEEERWSLESSTIRSNEKSMLSTIVAEIENLIHTWTLGIREIISRIHHASQALFLEISRGFFLPFATVGVSALARIRSMLLEIGRRGLTKLKDIQSELMMISKTHTKWLEEADYELYMREFLDDIDPISPSFGGPMKQDHDALLASLGLTTSHKKTKGSGTTTKGSKVDFQTKESTTMGSLDDQDFGEAVVSADSHVSSKVELDNAARSGTALESNMAFVQSFQKKTKGAKKPDGKASSVASEEKVSKKRKSSLTDTSKDNNKASKKKKKKSKKKNKENFFDDLFDT